MDGSAPLFAARSGRGGVAQFTIAQHPLGGRSRLNCPCGKARTMGIAHRCHADTLERDSTKWRHEVLVLAGSAAVNWNTRHDPRAGFGAHQALQAPKIASRSECLNLAGCRRQWLVKIPPLALEGDSGQCSERNGIPGAWASLCDAKGFWR